jgi:hypothetical protein
MTDPEPRREHVILVAVIVETDSRLKAEQAIHRMLITGRSEEPGPEEAEIGWWIAEDSRYDGSDNDSAVFVKPGHQLEARDLLRAHRLA